MPAPANNLVRVKLKEIGWTTDGQVDDSDPDAKEFEVQFNPESLKLVYTSTKAGGDQSGGSAIQYVGQGTSKLSMDLVFDASRDSRVASDPDTGESSGEPDVRNLTQQVIDFIKPKEEDRQDAESFAPPGLRVQWGSFLFEGVVDSVNETLDYWTEDGRPLQARVSLSMSRQEIQVRPPNLTTPSGNELPGTTALSPSRDGDSVAGLAGRNGDAANWQDVAAANGIENPRALGAGTLLDLKAGVSIGVSASASASLGLSAGVSASADVSAGFGVSAGVSGSISASTSVSASVSASTSSTDSLSARLTAKSPSSPKFSFALKSPGA
jgi:hypothetical protein